MPKDTSGGNNMPAIWTLNSEVGRTGQYPLDPSYTCWPACGEFDCWEVLSDASAGYMTSHLHSPQGAYMPSGDGGGGSNYYFDRPYDDFMYGAVAFTDDGKISISRLDSFDFPESLSHHDIKSWVQDPKITTIAR